MSSAPAVYQSESVTLRKSGLERAHNWASLPLLSVQLEIQCAPDQLCLLLHSVGEQNWIKWEDKLQTEEGNEKTQCLLATEKVSLNAVPFKCWWQLSCHAWVNLNHRKAFPVQMSRSSPWSRFFGWFAVIVISVQYNSVTWLSTAPTYHTRAGARHMREQRERYHGNAVICCLFI